MLAGFWLRFHLACSEDLATDEIATLVTASQQFPKGIINALVTKNFHAPLYYILLHFWMLLFGDSTISLRIMPVIFGTLCIPAAYACGKELFSKYAGFSAAFLVAINAFMINYSYFGKFYALLELLGFLSIYLIIKINKSPLKKYFVQLAFVNILIIYTYVIGFVFVGIQFLVFAGYDFIQKKQNLKKWILYLCWLILLAVPLVPMMYEVIKNTQNPIAPGFWWYKYESEHIITVLMTWFSPAIPYYFIGTEIAQVLPGHWGWSVLWNLWPTLLAVIIVYVTVRKEKFLALLLIAAFGFLFCEFIATLDGRFALVPRYTLLAFPAIILSLGAGIALFGKRAFSYVALSIFLALNLGYLSAFSNVHAPSRNQILPLAHQLSKLHLHKGDKVIIPMRGYLLTYFYHPKNVDIISFDLNYVFKTGDPETTSKIYSAQDLDEVQNTANQKQKFIRYLNSKKPTEAISDYFNQNIVKDLNPDSQIVLVDSCVTPVSVYGAEDEEANAEMSDAMFFYAFCEKVTSDIKAVLTQNKFQLQPSETIGSKIFIYN